MGTTAIDATEAATSEMTQDRHGAEAVCRALDVILAVVLLLVMIPVVVVAALAIRLDSSGPVLFRQRRLGRSLSPFTVYKLRTMKHGAGDGAHRAFVSGLIAGDSPEQHQGQPRFKLGGDTRVTRVGRFLRRSSLDEVPQLWNVLRGEMSLVGPRPSLAYEVEQYPPQWLERFAVKPGLTGLWQVSGRSELTMQDMIALDIEYVRRRSLRTNLSILARTVPAVLSLKGAS